MNADILDPDELHLLGERATHPIELPWGALGALLLLAGSSQPRRRAFPAHPMTAHSGVSNCAVSRLNGIALKSVFLRES